MHRERRLQPADGAGVRGAVPASVEQLTPFDYRDPGQLPDGGVLVVGASATGVQLAAEIRRSGRPVTLSVGEHVRLPRTYRGRDVLWWMDASGVWDQRYDEVDDLTRARRLPSPQLVGTPERATLDLNALDRAGRRAGRPLGGGPRRPGAVLRRPAQRVLAGRPEDGAAARHLRRVGARPAGATPRSTPPSASSRRGRPRSARLAARPAQRRDPHDRLGDRLPARLRLARRAGASTRRASCATTAASSTARGCTRSGLPVLRRRKSTFIHGIEDDAREVIDHLAGYLAARG